MNTIVLITRQLESGMSQRQIASLFKVGRRRVRSIKDVMANQGISVRQIEGMSEKDLIRSFLIMATVLTRCMSCQTWIISQMNYAGRE